MKYHVNSRMKLDIHPQRWKSTCTSINEGDTIEAVCKKFLAIRRKPPKLRQVDEFERFALSFTTDYGSEPGYELTIKLTGLPAMLHWVLSMVSRRRLSSSSSGRVSTKGR